MAALAQGGAADTNNIQAIQALPEPIKHSVLSAFTQALDDVFLVGVPLMALALIVSFFLVEVPLRTAASRPASDSAPVEALSAGL